MTEPAYDPALNGYRCWELAIAEIRKELLRRRAEKEADHD